MKKVLVFVHGAGKQSSDYAVDPLVEIALRLGAEPLAVPVYYADIANIGDPADVSAFDVSTPPPENWPEAQQFKKDFADQLQVNMNLQQQQPPDNQTVSTMSLPFLVQLVATEINELTGYLFNPDIYNKIQARMCAGLDEAASQGDTLVIASHSLGTIVAFDALKSVGDRYNVATFVTLGCPLAILRRLGSRSPDLGAITPAHVARWLNFYCIADPVSSVVGPSFPAPGYRPYDIYVNVAPNMPAAHDYFRNREVLDALAQVMS